MSYHALSGFPADLLDSIRRWIDGKYTTMDHVGCPELFVAASADMHPDVPAVLDWDEESLRKWPCMLRMQKVTLNATAEGLRMEHGGRVGDWADPPTGKAPPEEVLAAPSPLPPGPRNLPMEPPGPTGPLFPPAEAKPSDPTAGVVLLAIVGAAAGLVLYLTHKEAP